MPTLRWHTPAPPDTGAFLMASRFEVRTLADVPRFLLKSLAAWKQVKGAPGAYGASLIAEPFKRTFWTLSAWESKDALYAYARAEPHRSVTKETRSTMKTSVFTFWEAPPVLDWTDARNRLAEEAAK
ncbi:DUF3291 domain-containing protein [Streptomyces sp. NPDC004539]|uniref:DUF3291 domain-containing protein n=1 Tax=Streptomyces sp. NPDC004539 TaxID=3154280 RepID=UPI0033A69652